jgi:hypothetical protein
MGKGAFVRTETHRLKMSSFVACPPSDISTKRHARAFKNETGMTITEVFPPIQ